MEPCNRATHAASARSSRATGQAGDFSASVPGKPFLQALLVAFEELEQQQQMRHRAEDDNSSDGSFRRRVRRLSSAKAAIGITDAVANALTVVTDATADEEFVLRINAQCLFYLQELFRAMLKPVTSASGLVTQWRINSCFLDGFEGVEESDLGPAAPRKILKLGGHMLEQIALVVNGTTGEANLGAPGSFDLALFPRVQYLRLDKCNPVDVKNVVALRSRLKKLRCYNQPIDRLSDLLDTPEPASTIPKKSGKSGSEWSQLESLAVVNSSLTELDSSVELLSVVRTIRLSQNQLSSIEPLKACTCLQKLDVSQNAISSMTGVNRILPQIISLDLSHNRLSSTAGLEKLFTLEVLNLAHNEISSIAEVGYLVSLPNLHSIFLKGNPIERSSTYRSDVQKLLTNEVTLDGVPWASQSVSDFARQSEPKLQGTTAKAHPVGLKIANPMKYESSASLYSDRVAVLLRSLLLASTAIVLVQGLVHLTWSRDIESERLLLIFLGSILAAGCVLYVVVSFVPWLAKQLAWRSVVPANPSAGTGEAQFVHEGSLRRITRRLSVCLVDDTFVRRRTDATNGQISLNILQSSLQILSESPEELPLLMFLTVCSQLQIMIELLSPACGDEREGGLVFAWNTLSRSISILEAGTSDLRTATLSEVIRDATDNESDKSAPSDSEATALHTVADIVSFMATFLLELTATRAYETRGEGEDDTNSALEANLITAYRQVFAQQHPWIAQKTIVGAISASPLTQRAFFAALRCGNERVARNERVLLEVLRTCGEQLQVMITHDELVVHMLPLANGR